MKKASPKRAGEFFLGGVDNLVLNTTDRITHMLIG